MTMISATYPVASSSQQLPAVAASPRPWGFWSTLGWLAVAAVVNFAMMFVCMTGVALWALITHHTIDDIQALVQTPFVISMTTAITMPASALFLAFVAGRRATSVRSYFALVWPQWRHIAIGLGAITLAWAASFATVYFNIMPDFYNQSIESIREYRSILGNPVALAMFWLVLVVTAPVSEELIFRGFVMRGWSASRLGGIGAVVLAAAVFAAIHVQYNPVIMTMVFGVGLMCGIARLRSGSTVLAIMMHATWNLYCGFYYAYQATVVA